MTPFHRFCAAVAALGALALPACERSPRELTAAEMAALKAEVKAELRAELARTSRPGTATAHPADAPAPAPLPPLSLSTAERLAIAEARARTSADASSPPTSPPVVEPRLAAVDRRPPRARAPADPREVPADRHDDRVAPPPDPRHDDDDDDDDAELSPPAAPSPVEPADAVDREVGPAREVRAGMLVYPNTGALKLLDLAVGTAITDREPRDVRTTYDRVPELFFCYTVFDNPVEPLTVTHVWRRGTRLVSRVDLEIGKSPGWRTWSRQRTRADWVGPWSCEVLDPDGRRLGIASFEIAPPR